MNPMTNVKNVKKLSEQELSGKNKTSWHDQYKDSAWIFVGGLPYDLTEGDVICVFSQYGEIVNLNLVRDKGTGKSKGFCFICYEDQRSTNLAVDNLNGIKLLSRTIRVDHVNDYKAPKDSNKLDDETRQLHAEGCAPGSKYGDIVPELPSSSNGGLDKKPILPPLGNLLGRKTEPEEKPKVKVKKEKKDKKNKKNKKDKKDKSKKENLKKEIKNIFKKKKKESSSDSESSSDDDSSSSDSETEKRKQKHGNNEKKKRKSKKSDSSSSSSDSEDDALKSKKGKKSRDSSSDSESDRQKMCRPVQKKDAGKYDGRSTKSEGYYDKPKQDKDFDRIPERERDRDRRGDRDEDRRYQRDRFSDRDEKSRGEYRDTKEERDPKHRPSYRDGREEKRDDRDRRDRRDDYKDRREHDREKDRYRNDRGRERV